MTTLQELLARNDIRPPDLARHLDGLSHEARVTEIRSLTGKEQNRLYDLVAGAVPIGMDHFVPPAVGPLTEVIHHGKNSLPMFTHFQKRFCRPSAQQGVLYGYNEQTMRWATGPGYFVVRPVEAERRVVIDYTLSPPEKPAEWPTIHPNSRGLSRFVYYRTMDFMWKVSEHVSVGQASRDGKPMPNWFVLCREDR